MNSPADLVCALTFSFCRSFSSPSSWRAAAGLRIYSPPFACGFMAFSVQSEGWENQALSLERDCIDVVGRTVPLIQRPFPRHDAERVPSEVSGLYRKVA